MVVDGHGHQAQPRELEGLARDEKARILDPRCASLEAEHAQGQAESAAESRRDDDLRRIAFEATRDREVARDLVSQLELATWIGIAIDRLGLQTNGARAEPRDELRRKTVLRRHAHLEHRRWLREL